MRYHWLHAGTIAKHEHIALPHPDDRDHHAALFHHVVTNNQPFVLEVRYLRKVGNLAWVNLSLSRIHNAFDEPISCVAVVVDVTERTLTAQALQASEERLRLAENAAELGIFDINLLNNTIQCNQRVMDIWGFGNDEPLTCENFMSGIHPDDQGIRKKVLAEVSQNPAGTGEYLTEYRVIHRRERYETWISVIGRVFFNADEAVRVVGIIQDISKRKLNERKRAESDSALRSLLDQQVAAQTASAIAHELNQALAAISAYSEVARQALIRDSINVNQLDRALQGCVEQAQRAGRTLHDLLKFLQKNEIVFESLDLKSLVTETVAISQNDGFGGFSSRLQLKEGLPPVRANRLQIQMVLINLIRNSVEATRRGKMEPAIARINVQTNAKHDMALVTIQDDGPGFASDIAGHIFDPFFSTKSGGIGMGLPISRALVEANGDKLWFYTQERFGTVVYFTLPFD